MKTKLEHVINVEIVFCKRHECRNSFLKNCTPTMSL